MLCIAATFVIYCDLGIVHDFSEWTGEGRMYKDADAVVCYDDEFLGGEAFYLTSKEYCLKQNDTIVCECN